MGREHLGRQVPELVVALEVVLISRIGQAILGYGLQAPGPSEPPGRSIFVSRRYAFRPWPRFAATSSMLRCSAFHGYGIQAGLYLRPAIFEKRRKRQPLAEVRAVLVGGETGAVGGDLEEHPARLAEVDRTEIVAVYLRRHPEPRATDLLPPCGVLFVV